MSQYAVPVLFTLAMWWASTGLILILVRLPRATFRVSVLAATVVLGLGIHGLSSSSGDASVTGAYVAFASALGVWSWLEVTFLLGLITGPRKDACPAGCHGSRHFRHSVEAVIYHEVAILAGAALVTTITWDGVNQIGCWTFMVLWIMRLSAKLNLFLGVPNRGEQFLPPHLVYLKSFFGRRSMNGLFPVSITGTTLLAGFLIARAALNGVTEFEITGYSLLVTLVLLALIEHWFMVLPLPSERLWQWQKTRTKAPPDLPADLDVALPLVTSGTLNLTCRIEKQKNTVAPASRRAHAAGESLHD
jgi:putative photosynthetic complex assembly protein 2